jgi:hypothetical protein
MSLKPGGPRPASARETEVRSRFEECWAAAGSKSGASKGQVHYGGRELQSLITALRRSEKASALPANANDALFLVKSWGVPDGELEHYTVEKEKMKTWWINEVLGYQGHLCVRARTRMASRARARNCERARPRGRATPISRQLNRTSAAQPHLLRCSLAPPLLTRPPAFPPSRSPLLLALPALHAG